MKVSLLGRRSGDERRRRFLSLSVAGDPASVVLSRTPSIASFAIILALAEVAVSYDPCRIFGWAA